MDMHSFCILWKRKLELDTWAEPGLEKCDPAALPKGFKWAFSFQSPQDSLEWGTCGHWRALSYYWIWGLDKKNRLPKAALCPNPAWKDPAFHQLSPLPSLFHILHFTLSPQVTWLRLSATLRWAQLPVRPHKILSHVHAVFLHSEKVITLKRI